MDAAWEQVGDVLEANRRIRSAQLAREVAAASGTSAHLRPLLAAQPERALALTAPVHAPRRRRRRDRRHQRAQSARAAGADLGARCAGSSGRAARLVRALPFDGAGTLRRRCCTRVERRRGQRRAAEGRAARRRHRDEVADAALAPACRSRSSSCCGGSPWLALAPLVLAAIAADPAARCSAAGRSVLVVGGRSSPLVVGSGGCSRRWRRPRSPSDVLREDAPDAGGGRRSCRAAPTSSITEPGAGVHADRRRGRQRRGRALQGRAARLRTPLDVASRAAATSPRRRRSTSAA